MNFISLKHKIVKKRNGIIEKNEKDIKVINKAKILSTRNMNIIMCK